MLEIKNLSVKIKNRLILDSISLSVTPHTVTAVIGKNAAGKSTLLSCLNGERKYTGQITLNGKDLSLMSTREKALHFSLLPQQLTAPDITGEHLVRLGRTPHLDTGKHFTADDRAECEKAILLTGTENLRHKKISEMSGGERQKIFLAMVLAQSTELIALDEPTSHMDSVHEREFYTLLTDIVKKQKKTALVVMHDLTRAVEIADSIVIIDNGKLLFHGSSSDAKNSGIIERVFSVKGYDVDGIRLYR